MFQVTELGYDFHLKANLKQYDDYFHLLVEDYKNQKQLLVNLICLHF